MKPVFVSLIMAMAASAAFAAVPAAAAAAGGELTATLQSPLTKAAYIVRDQTAWSCEKDQCRATAVGQDANSWLACKALVRRVGPVSAYGSLDAEALAKYNKEGAK